MWKLHGTETSSPAPPMESGSNVQITRIDPSATDSSSIIQVDQVMRRSGSAPAADPSSSTEFQLKQSLLLLATLVATVTYAAGLNLPGGAWPEDTPGGALAGDPILRETHYHRYIVFYYCNATAFAASLVVCLLLLVLHEQSDHRLLRAVMLLDLFGLMGSYAAGSSRDRFTTVCASVLVFAVVAYVAVAFLLYIPPDQDASADERDKEHEILMVLAIFAATIAYVAGLNPPGGFWQRTRDGHTAGDPVLQDHHRRRYQAFFFFNTTAFVASLFVILLIVQKINMLRKRPFRFVALYVFTVVALLGLGGAYAAGVCRDPRNTAAVLALGALVLVYIFLQMAIVPVAKAIKPSRITLSCKDRLCCTVLLTPCFKIISNFFTRTRDRPHDEILEKAREFIQLLAVLAASIAYQAGLDPPGGLWSDNGDGHAIGEPILLTTHPRRYKVFFYCNSAAFVASLVTIMLLQSASLVRRHVLEAAMILDLFSLIGAYAAGSCRDIGTSIYIVAVAGAVFIYVVIHIIFFTLDQSNIDDVELEKHRQVLLLLAILAATLTYQAGLTPPGGFWEMDDKQAGHSAGNPVFQDNYPRHYKAFFYCNAASFMASVALIILLVNPNMYRPGIRCYALYVCMVAGMFGLMGAYTAGSSLHLRATIFVFILVALVFTLVVYLGVSKGKPRNNGQEQDGSAAVGAGQEEKKEASMPMYLMLLGILAASVTYLTGLKPPGGLWKDGGGGHSAGSPILYDVDKRRYNAFFYCNSTSFMASIIVIAFLFRRMVWQKKDFPLWPMHTAMLLDMLALLGAYAAGSAREWETSRNVILMLFPMLFFVAIVLFLNREEPQSQPHASTPTVMIARI